MSDSDLKQQVKHIKDELEGRNTDWKTDFISDDLDHDSISASDYLTDALDIEYIVNGNKEYLGARVLVAFGGPNIWINTRSGQIEGYWWSDKYITNFTDELDLDDVLRELWECA